MLIGVTVPNIGPLATSGAAVEIAEHAERLGFASVWTVDHVLLPHVSSETYPYTYQPGAARHRRLSAAAAPSRDQREADGQRRCPVQRPAAAGRRARLDQRRI